MIARARFDNASPIRAQRIRDPIRPRLRRVKVKPQPWLLPFSVAPASAARCYVLHEIFEAQADLHPEATAIEFGSELTTYAELEKRANRLARHLRARGVRRDPKVALLLPRGPDLYAAMLGILKAGAAYVPIDPDCPTERVRYILENAEVATLVTNAEFALYHPEFAGAMIRLDADHAAIEAERPERLPRNTVGVGPRDLCYIIYTSGSTGRPKGVMIEHRNACHLVCAEANIFGVKSEDRVYQGFSLSFDASIEEIWLAFQAGATLVAATPEMSHAGPDLSRLLTEARVTVLSCVPTLLAMLDEDVPTLRLLILGGEACPQKLVERWAQPGRRMVNTYGPTETTVIATYAELSRGEPVTIGRAVPGYQVHLCDDGLRPVTNGDVGEIWIGGAGVARGYVGLPGSTEARFVPDPFAPDETDVRIYRTGDLGRFDHAGNIEFLGRADSQVKLRGFRVELSEIESVLMTGDGVLAAACAVCEDVPGVQQLVGYIVPSNGHVDEDRLRSLLRNRLPSYMVPAFFEIVRDLPRLPSGKLDRTALPAPLAREESSPSIANRPQTDLERRIETVWKKLFGPHPISLDHDFFLDLGGHSLLAARMVSELRKDPQFASVSMVDVYENPTIASLAGKFENAPHPAPHPIGWGEVGRRPGEGISARSAVTYFDEQSKSPSEVSPEPSPAPQEKSHDSNRRQHFAAGVLQSGGLYFVYGFRALHWVTPYLVYFFLLENNFSALASAAWAVTSAVAALPALMLVSIAIKWLVLGCIRAGRYPLWGAYYVRFWFVRNLIAALPLSHLCGTPLLAGFYRLLGARIGKDVHLETDQLVAYDLISIGDGTSIDDTAWLLGCAVENGELVIGPIQIGQNCFVGTRCVLREHTTMEDGARLDDLSLLSRGERIPHNESWAGSPARRGPGATSTTAPPRPRRSPLKSPLTIALYAALMLVIPALPLAAFVPGVALLMRIGFLEHPFLYLAAAPLVGALFVLLLTIGVVIFKKLLVGRVQPGTYPVHGSFYIRKWIVDQLLAISLDVVGSLHATLWLSPWYRALGAKLGKSVELSTATSATPDLLEIGDGGTVADEVSFGAAHIEGGWMTLAPTRLGQRAFVGNGAVLPPGTVIGDHSLVGVLSLAPTTRTTDAGQSGATWMGSPPILLPRRQASTPYPDAKTFCPTKRTRLARGAFELLRVTLPPAGFILVTTAVVTAALALWNGMGLWATILTLPIFYAASCAAVALGVAALKWLVMGRFRRFEYPLITPFVWRLELVNALYEFLITPLTLEALQGTPFLPWYYRLLGAKIGRRTYFHTTGLIEFDLVEVGDEAAVNEDCVLQTHLFEDRVLKAASLRVGRGCSMGAGSVVLYDSEMKAGSRLDALSLLMKGEVLPAGTSWAGSPARRRSDQHENVGANF